MNESNVFISISVNAIDERKGTAIACLEEIAYNNGWIDSAILVRRIKMTRHKLYACCLRTMKRRARRVAS